jgi:hypothetical protein
MVQQVGRAAHRKDVESLSRMPAPIIYSANAGKIGLLEGHAMDVVIIYTALEGARDSADRLATTYMSPDDISPAIVLSTAGAFLTACEYGRANMKEAFCRNFGPVSLRMTPKDEALTQKINAALA